MKPLADLGHPLPVARSRAAAGSAVVEVVFQASSFIGILAYGMAAYALVILAQETVGSQSVTGSAFATLYAPTVVLTSTPLATCCCTPARPRPSAWRCWRIPRL